MICSWYEILDPWLTCHVEDAVTSADMGQEGISQALARMSTFHQASNVNDIKECWDSAAIQEVKGKNVLYCHPIWQFLKKTSTFFCK